jgi:protein required for attachment to host cells
MKWLVTLIYFRNSGHKAKTSTADVTKQNVWNDVDKRDARQTDEKSATLNDNAFCTLNIQINKS